MNHGPFQKKYLVSPEDMDRLVEHYKGTLTENSRLTHAARLAAKQHVLLTSDLPSATKKIRVKALGRELRRATKRVRQMHLPPVGAAAGDDDEDDLAQGPLDTFLKTLIKSNTPKRVPHQSTATQATPKPKPKIPPKPAFSVPLPQDDWEEELAAPIPSTSKSKGPGATLSKGKSPLTGTSKGKTPLTAAPTKKTRFRFTQQAVKEGKKLGKELLKLKRQPGWSELGEKVQRKLDGKDY